MGERRSIPGGQDGRSAARRPGTLPVADGEDPFVLADEPTAVHPALDLMAPDAKCEQLVERDGAVAVRRPICDASRDG
jgi:hypothetical protein